MPIRSHLCPFASPHVRFPSSSTPSLLMLLQMSFHSQLIWTATECARLPSVVHSECSLTPLKVRHKVRSTSLGCFVVHIRKCHLHKPIAVTLLKGAVLCNPHILGFVVDQSTEWQISHGLDKHYPAPCLDLMQTSCRLCGVAAHLVCVCLRTASCLGWWAAQWSAGRASTRSWVWVPGAHLKAEWWQRVPAIPVLAVALLTNHSCEHSELWTRWDPISEIPEADRWPPYVLTQVSVLTTHMHFNSSQCHVLSARFLCLLCVRT